MKLENPQTWRYEHPNFGAGATKVWINDSGVPGILVLHGVDANGNPGSAQLEHQDNGTVKIRIDEGPGNIFFTEVV